MTETDIFALLSILAHGGVFFAVNLGIMINVMDILDTVPVLRWRGEHDMAWLCLLMIPVELCVSIIFSIVLLPHIF